jgi:hypothetical protein
MPNQNNNLQISSAFFHYLSKNQTENNNTIGNELYKSSHNITSNEIWVDQIPYAINSFSASIVSDNIIVKQIGSSSIAPDYFNNYLEPIYLYPLAQSNYQTWFIDIGTPSCKADGFLPSNDWVRPLINPSDSINNGFPSIGYNLLMYSNNGAYIPYGSAYYEVDYFSGLIKFDPNRTPIDLGTVSGLYFQFNQDEFESITYSMINDRIDYI